MAENINLTGVLDKVDQEAEGEQLTLDEILHAFGDRGYGPLLLSAALIELLPTGAIPGVPTVIAVIVILIAGQLVLGRQVPWLPGKLRSKGVSREKFETAREKIRPITQKLDKAVKPRMQRFTTRASARLVGGVCVLLALTMPPLEVVPFASSIPSAAIGLFGLGLSARDGLIIVLAMAVAVIAGAGAVYWLAF